MKITLQEFDPTLINSGIFFYILPLLENYLNFLDYFGELELKEIEKCKSSKRKKEKIFGKLAAKVAYYKFSNNLLKNISFNSIERNWLKEQQVLAIGGPPELKGNKQVYLSISHSKLFAIAACASIPIGVDLELIRPIEKGAYKFFLTKEEIFLVEKLSKSEPLISPMIWFVLKEAFLKSEGIGLAGVQKCYFFEDAIRGSCFSFFNQRQHKGEIFYFKKHLLAFAYTYDKLNL